MDGRDGCHHVVPPALTPALTGTGHYWGPACPLPTPLSSNSLMSSSVIQILYHSARWASTCSVPDPLLGPEKTSGGGVTVERAEKKENVQCLTSVTAAGLANRKKRHSGQKRVQRPLSHIPVSCPPWW